MRHQNWHNEEYMTAQRRQVFRIAEHLLNGKIEFLFAVRELVRLQHQVSDDNHDPDFRLFVVIDSETDHLPVGKVREQCAPDWLAKCEMELSAIQSFYHSAVVEACAKLMHRFNAAPN